MKRNSFKKPLILFIIALAICASVFLPLPYYIEKPGSTIDLKELITVNDKKDQEDGSFSLTSVGVQQASVVTALKAQISPFEDLVSEEELLGGASDEEYDQMQNYYMESSQNTAIQQALKLADRPYDFEYKGVYVMNVMKNSSFKGEVAVGDTVTKVDGKSFENNQDFMDYVQQKSVGDTVKVTYEHDDDTKEASGKLIKLPSNQKAGIGITLVDHTDITTEDEVDFDVDNIGGPSAGLMFTLEIYEQLTEQNLRQNKNIAGTGTIDNKGKIGRIGGIDKKVASADEAGAQIFFAPNDTLTKKEKKENPDVKSNYQEAQTAADELDTDMKIVPVKTLQDAIDYLEQL
ncbi:SepM family pheromone-processing serine protease [Tetragenococcus koreensis]|uniref:SepM family pheromone-processing serine protease n=1 Tax=Tetragenococcus koreensis TaxID=290335 RepID=UPI000F4D6A9E|nr:SepM family pheromone-processing serine protease [Tetragenococcus koreensis]AYW45140.1 peptidase [Tetragenococcus koreensis]MCF1616536.1 PDZ domain-containing protein [Tetragenococcus koreensis]MCF1679800.1 PDZ domain-containing protein [Tetragenococcus koreensis]MDN6249391.1 PDZ domain-containing protein [Tetragenococcus koreensis]MDN6266593.1 PDZ domain-containing protein [Tetragenococcus koreensis]